MGIKYYVDRVQKKSKHFAEEWVTSDSILTDSGGGNSAPAGFSYVFAPVCECEVSNVILKISAGAAKDYAIKKIVGRGIASGLNDMLYMKSRGKPFQIINLDAGFYRIGSDLATEIKTQLDANSAFVDLGLTPFTVTFDAVTGKFTIQTFAGQIGYIDQNTGISVRQFSTAGHVIGFMIDATPAASIISDTSVIDIGTEVDLASDTASTDQNVVITEIGFLGVDEGILIEVSNTGGMVQYSVAYRNVT